MIQAELSPGGIAFVQAEPLPRGSSQTSAEEVAPTSALVTPPRLDWEHDCLPKLADTSPIAKVCGFQGRRLACRVEVIQCLERAYLESSTEDSTGAASEASVCGVSASSPAALASA